MPVKSEQHPGHAGETPLWELASIVTRRSIEHRIPYPALGVSARYLFVASALMARPRLPRLAEVLVDRISRSGVNDASYRWLASTVLLLNSPEARYGARVAT